MLTDPVKEFGNITRWLSTLTGLTFTPQKFVRRLSAFLNQRHPVNVVLEQSALLDYGDFTIGALYDVWDDEDGNKPLTFFFILNYPADEPWAITERIAEHLAFDIIETLIHEYRHLHQYRTRNYSFNRSYVSVEKDSALKEEQEYLGSPDEIDAYAANIAVKLLLCQQTAATADCSLDLIKYKKVFGYDHPVVRKLLKKVSKRLVQLQESQNTLI